PPPGPPPGGAGPRELPRVRPGARPHLQLAGPDVLAAVRAHEGRVGVVAAGRVDVYAWRTLLGVDVLVAPLDEPDQDRAHVVGPLGRDVLVGLRLLAV